MQELGLIKSLEKACFTSFSQSMERLILDLHPELLSGPLKVSSCSGHDIISVDVGASVNLQLAEPLSAHKLDHDFEGGIS